MASRRLAPAICSFLCRKSDDRLNDDEAEARLKRRSVVVSTRVGPNGGVNRNELRSNGLANALRVLRDRPAEPVNKPRARNARDRPELVLPRDDRPTNPPEERPSEAGE